MFVHQYEVSFRYFSSPNSQHFFQLDVLSAAPASGFPGAATAAPAPCSVAPRPAAAEAAAAAAAAPRQLYPTSLIGLIVAWKIHLKKQASPLQTQAWSWTAWKQETQHLLQNERASSQALARSSSLGSGGRKKVINSKRHQKF